MTGRLFSNMELFEHPPKRITLTESETRESFDVKFQDIRWYSWLKALACEEFRQDLDELDVDFSLQGRHTIKIKSTSWDSGDYWIALTAKPIVTVRFIIKAPSALDQSTTAHPQLRPLGKLVKADWNRFNNALKASRTLLVLPAQHRGSRVNSTADIQSILWRLHTNMQSILNLALRSGWMDSMDHMVL
ncbi:hypothetical protein K490DRAFT_63794 [Saccharata proteae CBS 121410]|uniref:Uncharacterized protein n=1 Tax=Saccharata proteae CBS 121410 TaxID=1314787 RepID=A0A6A5YFT8_9PEZI|nr:hypothetical protein K490DRAFT_63794 [Saccharata proteae CBS 121410]